MYSIFEKLLEEKGVTAYRVSKETGVGRSTFTDWKNGRSVPKQDKLQKIADFFNVSVDYLMTGKEPEKDFSVESAHLIAQIRKDTELSDALKKYFGLSDAKKKHVVELINLLSE
nr:MAG TPA: Repressor protein CI [Caudoviricetes sp.]